MSSISDAYRHEKCVLRQLSIAVSWLWNSYREHFRVTVGLFFLAELVCAQFVFSLFLSNMKRKRGKMNRARNSAKKNRPYGIEVWTHRCCAGLSFLTSCQSFPLSGKINVEFIRREDPNKLLSIIISVVIVSESLNLEPRFRNSEWCRSDLQCQPRAICPLHIL